jgi:hypothetical protein
MWHRPHPGMVRMLLFFCRNHRRAASDELVEEELVEEELVEEELEDGLNRMQNGGDWHLGLDQIATGPILCILCKI